MLDKTMIFSLGEEKDDQIKAGLTIVYDALRQKGYNPINQIVGYILSEDPTYITTYNNARISSVNERMMPCGRGQEGKGVFYL